MISYPTKKQSFLAMLFSTLKLYPTCFMTIFPFALLSGLTAALYIELVKLVNGGWLAVLAFAMIALMQVYFFACALKQMDGRLLHDKSKLKSVCIETMKQMGLVYAGFFLCIIIFCLSFSVGYFFVKILSMLAAGNLKLIQVGMIVFVGLPLLFVSVWLLLLVPRLVIYKQPLSLALVQCFKSVGFKNWSVSFYLYFLVALLVYFSAPGSLHMAWLNDHYLVLPFNAVLYVAWLPLIVNYTLLLMHRIRPS